MPLPWDETGFGVEFLLRDEFLDVINRDRVINGTAGAMQFAWVIADASADGWEGVLVLD